MILAHSFSIRLLRSEIKVLMCAWDAEISVFLDLLRSVYLLRAVIESSWVFFCNSSCSDSLRSGAVSLMISSVDEK